MTYHLLNSSVDPYRMIRVSGVPRDLQRCLQACLERIRSAENIIDLTHAHGRALGLSTGLGMAKAITSAQSKVLGEAYERALDDRLVALNEQLVSVRDSHQ